MPGTPFRPFVLGELGFRFIETRRKWSSCEKISRTCGRISIGANYIGMDADSPPADAVAPVAEAGFVRLFARHELALRNYARMILPDWAAVDDVLQDASVTMWEKRTQLRDENGFLPWGKVIVRHKCLNAIAKLRRDRLVLDTNVLELIAREDEQGATSGESDRIQLCLAECLGELTPDRRELVLAPYHGAGAVTMLAERSKKTSNAVYKIIGRLRAQLSECVETKLKVGLS